MYVDGLALKSSHERPVVVVEGRKSESRATCTLISPTLTMTYRQPFTIAGHRTEVWTAVNVPTWDNHLDVEGLLCRSGRCALVPLPGNLSITSYRQSALCII